MDPSVSVELQDREEVADWGLIQMFENGTRVADAYSFVNFLDTPQFIVFSGVYESFS